jgi:outer membrane translocation and assembly module TamA
VRQTRGTELRLSKIFSENVQFNIANQYKYVIRTPKMFLPDTFKGVTNSVKTQLMIDYRDEFFNPHTGLYLLPLIEYAGGILRGDNHFVRPAIEARYFIPLSKNTIAQRLKFGIIIPTDGVAPDEKYYLGGQYDLRGYPERAVGPDSIGSERYGNILCNYNLEARIALPWNFGLVTFLDAGYIDNEIDFTHEDFFKLSTGFGLRYYTPIGPLRCDIGFPIMDEGREIYLGIYHIF